MDQLQQRAHRIASSERFQNVIFAIIVLNALIIGLETYRPLVARWHDVFLVLDALFLAVYVVELVIRFVAVRCNPRTFFSNGWNVFDFAIVAIVFVPGMASNTTVLRLARLLRVSRLLRLMPDIHVLLDGLRRAAKPAVSLVALIGLIVYLYAVVGWSIFHREDPERWGNLGEAMLTLFTLLTLEGWNEILSEARAVSPWAVVYILSFILIGTFVVLNLVIGVVITSLDEAYSSRRVEGEGEDLSQAIDAVRVALDDLERKTSGTPGDPRVWDGA
jgi:voltage-gated sodium channel